MSSAQTAHSRENKVVLVAKICEHISVVAIRASTDEHAFCLPSSCVDQFLSCQLQ